MPHQFLAFATCLLPISQDFVTLVNYAPNIVSQNPPITLQDYFFFPKLIPCLTYSSSVMMPSLSASQNLQFFSAIAGSL